MARRRLADDLPAVWYDDAQAESRRKHRTTQAKWENA